MQGSKYGAGGRFSVLGTGKRAPRCDVCARDAGDGRYASWGGRRGYLRQMAVDYGLAVSEVEAIADSLGEREDFDALPRELEAFCEFAGLGV